MTLTEDDYSPYVRFDKTYQEINTAFESGKKIVGIFLSDPGMPDWKLTSIEATKYSVLDSGQTGCFEFFFLDARSNAIVNGQFVFTPAIIGCAIDEKGTIGYKKVEI